jgi:mannitol-1-phosphate/altronate dehydrogenase
VVEEESEPQESMNARIVGSMIDFLSVEGAGSENILKVMVSETIRLVSLTIEKGNYLMEKTPRGLVFNPKANDDVMADINNCMKRIAPKTVLG